MERKGEPILCAENLRKEFSIFHGLKFTISERLSQFKAEPAKYLVFDHVNIRLNRGECIGLFGGNGSGKSTLLRCLAGIMAPTQGRIEVNGKLASILSHGFGAYEDLPVWRNLKLVLQILGQPAKRAHELIIPAAEIAGVSERLLGQTCQLSEGMRAKIALSALMVSDFDIALLDESLNHVDAEFREIFCAKTRNWIKEGKTIVVTSHDDQLLERFATRKLRLKNKTITEC